jgi:cysteine-rich repeat protein
LESEEDIVMKEVKGVRGRNLASKPVALEIGLSVALGATLAGCYSPNQPVLAESGETGGSGDSGASSEGGLSELTQATDPNGTGGTGVSEECGDAVVGADEICDDGELNGGYGRCSADCAGPGPHCGDGRVQGDEACDDGLSNGTYGACAEGCGGLGRRCGDRIQDAEEQCDDGNAKDADGCNVDCVVSGSVLWEDSVVPAGEIGHIEVAAGSVGGGSTVVAATYNDPILGPKSLLRRYDHGGLLVWDSPLDGIEVDDLAIGTEDNAEDLFVWVSGVTAPGSFFAFWYRSDGTGPTGSLTSSGRFDVLGVRGNRRISGSVEIDAWDPVNYYSELVGFADWTAYGEEMGEYLVDVDFSPEGNVVALFNDASGGAESALLRVYASSNGAMIEENTFGVDGEMLLSSGLSVADNGNVFVIGNVACPSGQCGALVRLSGGLVEVGNVSYDGAIWNAVAADSLGGVAIGGDPVGVYGSLHKFEVENGEISLLWEHVQLGAPVVDVAIDSEGRIVSGSADGVTAFAP